MSKQGLEGSKIVVADDDPNVVAMVSHTLRRLGAEVSETSDGEEALARTKEIKPQLVVLDVMMPGMSGWEVCRAIREEEGLEETRVLMLTGIGERLNDMTSPLYGADDHIDKPFELKALEDKAKELLAE